MGSEGQSFVLVNKLPEDEESNKRVEKDFNDREKRLREENRGGWAKHQFTN